MHPNSEYVSNLKSALSGWHIHATDISNAGVLGIDVVVEERQHRDDSMRSYEDLKLITRGHLHLNTSNAIKLAG